MQTNAIFIMLVFIGALLVLINVIVFFKMRRPSRGAFTTTGVVIDQEENDDSDGTTYSPIVKFTAHDGTEITFTDAVASYPALYKVGEEVKVLYDRENFRHARLAASFRVHLISIALLLLGGIFLVVGLVGMRK